MVNNCCQHVCQKDTWIFQKKWLLQFYYINMQICILDCLSVNLSSEHLYCVLRIILLPWIVCFDHLWGLSENRVADMCLDHFIWTQLHWNYIQHQSSCWNAIKFHKKVSLTTAQFCLPWSCHLSQWIWQIILCLYV